MKKQTLYWTPRVLGILIVIFLTLLSTDVFMEGYSIWQALGGFLVHMLPAFAMLVALVLGWRWEWVGAAGFFGFGLWYIFFALNSQLHWFTFVLMAGIPGLTGLLFLLGWFTKKTDQELT